MESHWPILYKMLPLYMNIGLGYIAGKALDASRDTVARIMFYIINPLIVFNGVLNVKLTPGILTLPVLSFLISACLCLLFFRLSKNMWSDASRNLVAFSAGSGNTGYFGIPLALILFSNEGEGVYILSLMGITLYENTLGFYILARGTHPAWECLVKLIKLPSIYAFFGGLFLNYSQVPLPEVFIDFMTHIKGTYTVLGMMIIGLGISSLTHFKLDGKFIGMTFLAKFLVWPALVLFLIYLDKNYFGFYGLLAHNALILMSIVPLAVNTVIMASILKSQPEKAAAAVILSTLFAMIYVPLMVNWFIYPG